MKLHLKNVGKVRSAAIEINGITVIAGENNTGKSTVGKALFSVFNSFYQSEKKIGEERRASIVNQVRMLFRDATAGFYYDADDTDLIGSLIACADDKLSDEDLKQIIFKLISQFDEKLTRHLREEEILETSGRIVTSLRVQDDTIFQTILQRRLDAEFNEQICNLLSYDEVSEISLEIRGERLDIKIEHDKVVGPQKRLSLGTEAIYIDDPFVLDEVPGRVWIVSRRLSDHRAHLREKLYFTPGQVNVVEQIVANSKLDSVYSKVSAVCDGNVIKGKRSDLSYKIPGSDQTISVKNLSTGLKTFVILKMLLLNGQIESNGTIILDEPEIHLHPQWQLLFAELIVLLHREFGLHILLNTHSPYFLNAIEVYTAKYGVDDKCKYYLAENIEGVSYFEDVTHHIEKIYSKLARPLQDLENERYSDD